MAAKGRLVSLEDAHGQHTYKLSRGCHPKFQMQPRGSFRDRGISVYCSEMRLGPPGKGREVLRSS